MFKIFIMLFFVYLLNLQGAGDDILQPKGTIVDLTQEELLISYDVAKELDKQLFEVDKTLGQVPRLFVTDACFKDEQSENYECPIDLEECTCGPSEIKTASGSCESYTYSLKIVETNLCQSGFAEYGNASQCRKTESYQLVGPNNKACVKSGAGFYTSPYVCNNNNECGYGKCEINELPTTTDKIMPYEMFPIDSLLRTGADDVNVPCTQDFEYSDGDFTNVDIKKCYKGTLNGNKCTEPPVCAGTITNGKCQIISSANKITNTDYAPYSGETVFLTQASPGCCTDSGQSQCDSSVASWNPGRTCIYKSYYENAAACNPAGDGRNYPHNYNYDCGVYDVVGCPSGYTQGDNICSKTTSVCPSGYTDNGSGCTKTTLINLTCADSDFGLNYETCEKPLDEDYSYYTYACKNELNEFGFNWELVNDKTADPGCIDDTFGNCITVGFEKGSCRRQILGCESTYGECKNTGNGWQCLINNGVAKEPCYGVKCDIVANDIVTYCESSQCPTYGGVFLENDKCYIEECPAGTSENSAGKCNEF